MSRCPRCSAVIPDDARFCASCGKAIQDSSTPTVAQSPSPRSDYPSSAHGRFLPGTVVGGRYRIVALLGRGGMGEVYRADDLKLGQTVALKFLPESVEHDSQRLELLLAEVRLARQVSHPNVCRVFDAGEADGHSFISMEFVDGEDLASLLRRIGRLPGDKAIQIARQLCAGIAAAHEQGIVHRDLKPANVMIDGRGRARITDFGLATPGGAGGWVVGTPGYMAPEQREGREATVRSDVYSMGLVLYEVFTGHPAFPSASRSGHDSVEPGNIPPQPSHVVEGIDAAVERAIMRCLANDPGDRPSSALQVSAALPGGDPLAAALAAGEMPSPEMVAEAKVADAMLPSWALGLAAIGLALFGIAAWINGRDTLRSYVPLEKPPAAMVDRARETIRTLGYTEARFEHPMDREIGYAVASDELDSLARVDLSPKRWDRLRDPAGDLVTFWYRARPSPLVGTTGSVSRWDPYPQVPGEITVVLGLSGRLRSFLCVPRRFAVDTLGARDPDWNLPFSLAGLDPARFVAASPRLQRYPSMTRRLAWIGTRAEAARDTVRVEAAASEGRVALFTLVTPLQISLLSKIDPLSERAHETFFVEVFLGALLAMTVAAVLFVVVNRNRAHADRAGTRRAVRASFFLTLAGMLLDAHNLFSLAGLVQLPWALGSAVIIASAVWLFYVALEPLVRRVWPTMLISWSRLLSGSVVRAHDPLVGRSLLVGLIAGSLMAIEPFLTHVLKSVMDGVPAPPEVGDWTVILGFRHSASAVLGSLVSAGAGTLAFVFFLVLARLALRRQALAITVVLGLMALMELALPSNVSMKLEVRAAVTALDALFNAIMIFVLLRFGLLASIVAFAAISLVELGSVSTLSEWHGQPFGVALVAIVALATWGCWAASGGRIRPRASA